MTKLEQEYAEIMRDKKVLAAREKLIKEKLEKKYGQNAVSKKTPLPKHTQHCLLYTSDAADE